MYFIEGYSVSIFFDRLIYDICEQEKSIPHIATGVNLSLH
jgi:hypothetical protein